VIFEKKNNKLSCHRNSTEQCFNSWSIWFIYYGV